MGEVRVGVSGWSYPHWRGRFYPDRLPHRLELAYCAQRMATVEVNASFYGLQKPATYQAWAAATPEGFTFAVKGSRYITHLKRLRDVRLPLANFLASGPLALGARLGPLLWQLPEALPFDPDLLAGFLAELPADTSQAADRAREHDQRLDGRDWTRTDARRPLRHALEPRHPSYDDPRCLALLRAHGVALVVADTAGRFPAFDHVTADLVYVRLHGRTELYGGRYGVRALRRWADRIRRWQEVADVVVYFDNDDRAYAPHDALALADILRCAPPWARPPGDQQAPPPAPAAARPGPDGGARRGRTAVRSSPPR